MKATNCNDVLATPVDPISAALMEIALDNVVCVRSELTDPWALEVPVEPEQLMFHIPVRGSCWLLADEVEMSIGPGHFALVTEPGVHLLCSERGLPAVDAYALPTEVISPRMEVLRHGGGGATTTLICGVATLKHPLARLVLDALPNLIHTESDRLPGRKLVSGALETLSMESTGVSVGGAAVVNLLANLLVIEGIRAWLDMQDDDTLPQWFGALRHPQIGRVLAALHAEPSGHWSVERMAELASMSKSAFHDTFKRTVGLTPLKYTLHWRMHYAASRLATTEDSVSEVASACGYDSESAFSRAFRRELGYTPREARSRA